MTVDEAYFQRMYARDPDPWRFADRWYEQRRYSLTLAILRSRRYRSGFEAGCSIGLLSAALAARCDRLLCTDLVAAAVARTRDRLAGQPHVRVSREALPAWPPGGFDLVVLSEVLYYLTDDELTSVSRDARDSLEPGGDLVCAHWRHPVAEHRRTGDEVHDFLARVPGLRVVGAYRDADLRLEAFTVVPPTPRSVAQIEGLAP